MHSKIISTGAYVPETIVTNDDLSKIVDTNDEWIFSRSGISSRRFSTGENTSEIAAKAAKLILERAQVDACDVDLIIVSTVTADYIAPSTACLVQAAIGAKNAVAFDLNAACSGFIFALSTADKFIKSGVYKNALVLGSEVLSKYTDFTDRSTCVLFGDGAGGVLLGAGESGGIMGEVLGSDGSLGMSLTGGFSPVSNILVPKPQNNDFFLKMDGKAIFNFATRQTPKAVKTLIEKYSINIEEIKYIIPHQANARIVEIISRKLNVPIEKFYMNLNNHGNTSSASIPIALDEMAQKGLIKKGDKLILCGFGAGVTWGSLFIEY